MSSKVPAADNTLKILRLLASRKTPTPAAMIATLLDLPRSSVYQLLNVMLEHGFIAHYPEDKAYGLGVSAFELSSAYTRQEPMARLGAPLIAQLVDKIGESAHLAVLHGADVLYIVEERAKGRPSLVTDVGVRLPSHLTASGRAILASLPKSQVRALYPSSASFTSRDAPTAISSYSHLRRELDQTAQRGYAVERGDVTTDFYSLAVDIKDANGWPVAAVAVTFLSDRIPEEKWDQLIAPIRATAAQLTARVHGRRA
ncbi:IclR family transcriptional regulator [Glutamicibacter uratoxydans]|uniref:IclR family transcriptional regulator n=1 Tax=Glutamicibacter uratoxydans TaxID=43667 RepID=A0A4Y4DQE4_GLUUR|nr:IclR family transcriptional regulator [Glutamicibacter uratoxydans]GED05805.1 IclR family transcriptional regulator [Glutamicibacter uratoxydans]